MQTNAPHQQSGKEISVDHGPHSSAPSTGTDGFFQPMPKVENGFYEDEAFKRVFDFYLPEKTKKAVTSDLSRFGALVLDPSILAWTENAEKTLPYIRHYDTFGRRVDELITSDGWQKLQSLGLSEGIVAIAYENQYGPSSRVYQFLKYLLWGPTAATVTCPSAMQDGAATLLRRQLSSQSLSQTDRHVFQTAYDHLTSRDPVHAWTSGQWMTERAGGSDVRKTETLATYMPTFAPDSSALDTDGLPLGPWSLSGFKWFASAADSQIAITLARTPSNRLGAFLVPLRRRSSIGPHATEPNGISIQRLKDKLGTKSLPSAELVLSGTHGYMLGAPGDGVREISAILNITRIHNAVSAMGYWGRGLAVARAFARVRKVSGSLLIDVPAHVRSLAAEHVSYRAMLHLAFLPVQLLGVVENSGKEIFEVTGSRSLFTAQTAPSLLRILTPLSKALTALSAISGLRACMEALGGVGYIENADIVLNIARLYRDANVLAIWEGTTDVLAADCVRVLKGREGTAVLSAMNYFVDVATGAWKDKGERWEFTAGEVAQAWKGCKAMIDGMDAEQLKYEGRKLLDVLGAVVCKIMLGEDARRDGCEVAEEVFLRHDSGRIFQAHVNTEGWGSAAQWDRKIVYGCGHISEGKAKL